METPLLNLLRHPIMPCQCKTECLEYDYGHGNGGSNSSIPRLHEIAKSASQKDLIRLSPSASSLHQSASPHSRSVTPDSSILEEATTTHLGMGQIVDMIEIGESPLLSPAPAPASDCLSESSLATLTPEPSPKSSPGASSQATRTLKSGAGLTGLRRVQSMGQFSQFNLQTGAAEE